MNFTIASPNVLTVSVLSELFIIASRDSMPFFIASDNVPLIIQLVFHLGDLLVFCLSALVLLAT